MHILSAFLQCSWKDSTFADALTLDAAEKKRTKRVCGEKFVVMERDTRRCQIGIN